MEVNTLKRKLKAEEDEHKALNTLWEVINKLKRSINYRRHRLAYTYDFGVRLTIFWAILFLRPTIVVNFLTIRQICGISGKFSVPADILIMLSSYISRLIETRKKYILMQEI